MSNVAHGNWLEALPTAANLITMALEVPGTIRSSLRFDGYSVPNNDLGQGYPNVYRIL